MEKSYKVMKKAVDCAGAKKLASKLGISQALIYKWCQQPNDADSYQASGAKNPLDRLCAIYQESEDDGLIQWICQMGGGYFVKDPSKIKSNISANVLRNIEYIIKEFSESLDVISKSYNDDKCISIKESKLIRKEWDDLKRIGEGFVRACEDGRYDKK